MKKKLVYRSKHGVSSGQELSDIQEYNASLDYNTRWTKRVVYLLLIYGTIGLSIALWLIWYVITNDVWNTTLAELTGKK